MVRISPPPLRRWPSGRDQRWCSKRLVGAMLSNAATMRAWRARKNVAAVVANAAGAVAGAPPAAALAELAALASRPLAPTEVVVPAPGTFVPAAVIASRPRAKTLRARNRRAASPHPDRSPARCRGRD